MRRQDKILSIILGFLILVALVLVGWRRVMFAFVVSFIAVFLMFGLLVLVESFWNWYLKDYDK